jgi:hypothetical protein
MITPIPEDKDLIAVTPLGAALAMLRTPVLDASEVGDRNSSDEECDFYLISIAPQGAGERDAFLQILCALDKGSRRPQR